MITAIQLYNYLNELIPNDLSLDWDNDGLMCAAGIDDPVTHVLITLDVTEETVNYAVKHNADTIISHHPLIFKPLTSIKNNKLVKLIQNNITVMSFHTRLDIVEDGVNSQFANLLELNNIETFAEIGRVGSLPREYAFLEFIQYVKDLLNCERITAVKNQNVIKRVAVTGGDGKDFYGEALKTGADTYLTGNLSYNIMADALETDMNIIEAG
ncbi:MAG: Nif3-like dinuclear metal center hexameric protein, partial [Oscillospiraceae bacterium]|nr:Nif3-like dinuclear metal center hexameric protein [Oscillospiraceae bacterium]